MGEERWEGYGSGGQHPWKVLHDGYVLQDKVHVVPMKRVDWRDCSEATAVIQARNDGG